MLDVIADHGEVPAVHLEAGSVAVAGLVAVADDGKTFVCSIQHPHEGRAFEAHWPLDEELVSRPSVIGVRHKKGRTIGS